MPPSHDEHPEEPGPATFQTSPQVSPPASSAGVPLSPPDPANQQRAVAALFIAMLSLAGLLGFNDVRRGVYVALFGLLAGAVAWWLSFGSMIRARRGRTARPRGWAIASVIAGIGILLSAATLITFAVLGRQLSTYGDCLSGANTIAAQQSCQNQFTHDVFRKIAVLRSGGSG